MGVLSGIIWTLRLTPKGGSPKHSHPSRGWVGGFWQIGTQREGKYTTIIVNHLPSGHCRSGNDQRALFCWQNTSPPRTPPPTLLGWGGSCQDIPKEGRGKSNLCSICQCACGKRKNICQPLNLPLAGAWRRKTGAHLGEGNAWTMPGYWWLGWVGWGLLPIECHGNNTNIFPKRPKTALIFRGYQIPTRLTNPLPCRWGLGPREATGATAVRSPPRTACSRCWP